MSVEWLDGSHRLFFCSDSDQRPETRDLVNDLAGVWGEEVEGRG